MNTTITEAQPTPLVWIILLNWNGRDDTLACLQSLARLEYTNTKILVVDNDSHDGLIEILQQRFPSVMLLKNQENLGFAEGNNVGIRYVLTQHADYILLLNNDTIVDPKFLSELVAIGEAHPAIGMLSPVIYHYTDPETAWFHRGVIDWQNGFAFHSSQPKTVTAIYEENTDYLSGCALLVKVQVIRAIGLLDDRFFAYYEDVDWSLRCQQATWKLAVVLSASIWHKCTSDGNTDYGTFLSYRNVILLLWKHSTIIRFLYRLKRHLYRALAAYSWNREQYRSTEQLHPLDGIWAGLRGKYGNSRQKMPRWAQSLCYRYYRVLLWLFRSHE